MAESMASEREDDERVSQKGKLKLQRQDFARLKTVGFQHGAMVVAIVTLWASANQWAIQTELLLAQGISIASGFFAGVALAFLFHEWGHFSGARLAASVSPVLEERKSFFMFNFDLEQNSRNQFLMMSLGGPVANWLLVGVVWLALPVNQLASIMLLASTTGVAVNVCVFELPVINRVLGGAVPGEALIQRVAEVRHSGWLARYSGLFVGLGVFFFLGVF